ncbi:unnamed protein product [Urochloa humidicola]
MAPTIFPSSSGGILAVATGAFVQPRLLLVPAGARLPRGMHAVAGFPATPLAAAPGSGRRGAIRSVAVSAGSEAAGNGDDDYEMLDRGKKMVMEIWEDFERSWGRKNDFIDHEAYEFLCFAEDMVPKFQITASKGAKLVANVMAELVPEGMSDLNVSRMSDLNNLKIAGLSFRRIALEAQKGYVRASSVQEAANKLLQLYVATISRVTDPLISATLNDAPSPMDPSGYFNSLAETIARTVESVFLSRRG